MTDRAEVKKLTAEERDSLAEVALRQRERSRARSRKARAAKLDEGLVRVSVWCPKELRPVVLKEMQDMVANYRQNGMAGFEIHEQQD